MVNLISAIAPGLLRKFFEFRDIVEATAHVRRAADCAKPDFAAERDLDRLQQHVLLAAERQLDRRLPA